MRMKELLSGSILLASVWTSQPAEADDAVPTTDVSLPDASSLVQSVDDNLTFASRSVRVRMTVATSRRTRQYEMQLYGEGSERAAVEYLAPARDKGTRMLRLGGDVWTFMPSVERTQKISGHMLREGLMGSDMSYDDLMSAASWRDLYEAETVGDEVLDGMPVWRVKLTAKDASVAYPTRLAWIAKDTLVPLKQELYAVSGMLLKTWTMHDIQPFEGGRQFPMRMVIADALREGSSTTIELMDLSFGVALDDEVFSRRWLERR